MTSNVTNNISALGSQEQANTAPKSDILMLVASILLSCSNSLNDCAYNQARAQEGLANKQKHLADIIAGIKGAEIPDYQEWGSWDWQSDRDPDLREKIAQDFLTPTDEKHIVEIKDGYISIWETSGRKIKIQIKPGETLAQVAHYITTWVVNQGQYYERDVQIFKRDGDNSVEIAQFWAINQRKEAVRNVFQGRTSVFQQECASENSHATATAEASSITFSAIDSCLSMIKELTQKVVLPYNTTG